MASYFPPEHQEMSVYPGLYAEKQIYLQRRCRHRGMQDVGDLRGEVYFGGSVGTKVQWKLNGQPKWASQTHPPSESQTCDARFGGCF